MGSDNRSQGDTRQIGRGMIYMAWLLVLGLLTLFFSNMLDNQNNPNRELQHSQTATGVKELVLKRNRAGHYVASGRINGTPVRFLLDTGATDVAVPGSLAARLGLKRGRAVTSRTANGDAISWSTRIDEVDLGGLTMRNVKASILPGMQGNEVLLGMTYLKHLELIQRGDQLTLRQHVIH